MADKRGPRGAGSLYLRGETWWCKYHVDGKPVRESTGKQHEAAARRYLNQKLGEAVAGARPVESRRVRVNELLDLVVKDYKLTGKRSAYDAEKRIDANLRPHFGHVRVTAFRSALMDSYIENRRKGGAADATIERELKLLRRAFSLGLKHEPPLVARKPHIRALRADNVRTGFIEDEQYQRLLRELPGHLKAIFVCGHHTGLRFGTLRQLTWDQIDLDAKEIHIHASQTKQKRGQVCPIYGDLGTVLRVEMSEHQRLWPDVPWVFHFGKRQIGHHLKGWKEACKRAELPDLHFHDLRRSAVRNLVRAGVALHTAMAITGHSTAEVFRRYDIVDGKDLQDAAQKLEARQKALRKHAADTLNGDAHEGHRAQPPSS